MWHYCDIYIRQRIITRFFSKQHFFNLYIYGVLKIKLMVNYLFSFMRAYFRKWTNWEFFWLLVLVDGIVLFLCYCYWILCIQVDIPESITTPISMTIVSIYSGPTKIETEPFLLGVYDVCIFCFLPALTSTLTAFFSGIIPPQVIPEYSSSIPILQDILSCICLC